MHDPEGKWIDVDKKSKGESALMAASFARVAADDERQAAILSRKH